jgi:2-haloacid dehalogenase
MTYQWLLFDADDTLFDYNQAETDALRWTFEQTGAAYLPEYLTAYQRYNRQVWAELERGEVTSLELRTKRFRLLSDDIGSSLDPELVSPIYLRNLSRGIHLLDGALDVIQVLRHRYHLALVTNGLADVQRPRLEGSLLKDAFEQVFISEEIGAAKPDKACFDVIFQRIGQPPKKQVLIIGDSLTSDMQGGVNYGIDTCWYNPHGKMTDLPVTYQVTRLAELFEWL